MEMDSYKSQILDGVSWWFWYKNKIVQAGGSNCMRQCLNFLVLNIHIHVNLGSRGKSFFQNFLSFFGVSTNCR